MEEDRPEEVVVAVGFTGHRKSKYILRWALEMFHPKGNTNTNITFKLLHVYPKITVVPTPTGYWMPMAMVRDIVAASYKEEVERKKKKSFAVFENALKARKVNAEFVMLESDDVAMAISFEVQRLATRHLVIGVSSNNLFSRKNLSLRKMLGENQNLSSVISQTVPDFCSVYIISDGKLQHMRPADSEPSVINVDGISSMSSISISTDSFDSDYSPHTIGHFLKSGPSSPIYAHSATLNSQTSIGQQEQLEFHQTHMYESRRLPRKPRELRCHTYSGGRVDENAANTSFANEDSSSSGSWVSDQISFGGSFAGTPPTRSTMSTPPSTFVGTPPSGAFVGTPPSGSFVGTPPMGSFMGTPPTGSAVGTSPTGSFVAFRSPVGSTKGPSPSQIAQLEELRSELKLIEQMLELAQNNNIDDTSLFSLDQLNDLSTRRQDEALKLKEEKAKALANLEKHEETATKSGVSDLRRHTPQNKVERKTDSEAEENETKRKQLLEGKVNQYQKFTWEEIVVATSSFSEELKIGMGAFGTVYKCKLHHTTVAVKVLRFNNNATNKQFLQELEILSRIRHPNLLLLLGAVPEESCLVYEYMENGSLDDRLFCKDNTPPLLWYDRFRICWEVASALVFLHSTKPNPIIHRDLKPANILLDQNLVSKIGDAGLGIMMNVEPASVSTKTLYKETSPVGTLCYIDPEYQRTGRVSTKSDIYALGVVILQLLTAKPAVGIAYLIEDALDEGNFMELLDQEAGQWPEDETLELASLALQCAELRGRDRPDLREKVLPILERMKEIAHSAKESASSGPTAIPAHFICPILKSIMEDPYVAADGYTYDRRVIEQWLTDNDTSPTTNLPLPHKFIMPNYTLLEAIQHWKAKRPAKG